MGGTGSQDAWFLSQIWEDKRGSAGLEVRRTERLELLSSVPALERVEAVGAGSQDTWGLPQLWERGEIQADSGLFCILYLGA